MAETEVQGKLGPADWISKTLATLDVISGYTFLGLTVAGAVVLLLPSPFLGTDLAPIRLSYGGWIFGFTVVAAALTAARILRSLHNFILRCVEGKRARDAAAKERTEAEATRKRKRAATLAFLDTLSADEKRVFAFCLHNNQQTLRADSTDGPVPMLEGKGLVMGHAGTHGILSRPYTIPNFVWAELQRRKDEYKNVSPSLPSNRI